jgi:hypothetical protein
MRWLMAAVLILSLSVMAVVGCQSASNPQVVDVSPGSHTKVTAAPVVLVSSDPKTPPVVVPGASSEQDTTPKKMTATPQAWRIMTPFGPAPGESVSKMSDKPLEAKGGETPSIKATVNGIETSKADQADVKGQAGQFGIFDTIVQRAKDWGLLLVGILLIAGLVIIALKILGAYFPAVGTFLSSATAEAKNVAESTLKTTVTGVQYAKGELEKLVQSHPATAALTADQKKALADAARATVNSSIAEETGSRTPEAAAIAAIKDAASM